MNRARPRRPRLWPKRQQIAQVAELIYVPALSYFEPEDVQRLVVCRVTGALMRLEASSLQEAVGCEEAWHLEPKLSESEAQEHAQSHLVFRRDETYDRERVTQPIWRPFWLLLHKKGKHHDLQLVDAITGKTAGASLRAHLVEALVSRYQPPHSA